MTDAELSAIVQKVVELSHENPSLFDENDTSINGLTKRGAQVVLLALANLGYRITKDRK